MRNARNKAAAGLKRESSMNTPAKGFPLPSSLKVLPGTERALAGFLFFFLFGPADDERFWFYNSMHFPEPMSAFDMVTAEAAYCALGSANTRVHCLPSTLGIDHRIINGRVYIGGNAVTDPVETARRTEEFRQRAFYYYEHWERLYDQWREKMLALIRDSQALPKPELPELEPLEHRRAGELGVDAGFQEGANAADIIQTLEQSGAAGQAWLAELASARDPWFNINVGDGFYHYHRSWNDDLTMPFSGLPEYIRRGKAGESLERPVNKLQEERRQLIADYRELLNTDAERAAYDQMITLAHRVFPYVEGHKFYCEHWYTNLFFNKIREFGALLAHHGFFPDTEDVFHLSHYELEMAIIDLMTSWSNGSPPRGPAHWPKVVAERRAALLEWAKHDTPPALGPVPDVIDDPAIVMLWGITRESLNTWLESGGSEANSKEVRGIAASSGVVEGPAFIVKSVEEISRLRKGDILVCQVTNPTWAPVFQKIAAAVSDIGGSMSDAAIVAREYGLPAVVGTGRETERIPDGARVREDGGRGIVTILG